MRVYSSGVSLLKVARFQLKWKYIALKYTAGDVKRHHLQVIH